MITPLDDLEVLQLAEEISDEIWRMVSRWDSFAKNTVGSQIIRSADSIGANIAEAYGRFHYGEKLQFLYYARGSVFETKYWINRGAKRNLIQPQIAGTVAEKLAETARQINAFAKSLKSRRYQQSKYPKTIREDRVEYTPEGTSESLIFSMEDIEQIASIINLQS